MEMLPAITPSDHRALPKCYFQDMRVLVVDDDLDLCSMLIVFLQQHGFAVESEHEGNRGLSRALTERFDLLILDVMLPGLNGFEALRRLREQSQLPVLMLTAKGAREERVHGLQLGADDYLPKPFGPEELLARARAVLRRTGVGANNSPEILEVGELQLLPGARDAFFRGEKLGLTAMECEVLEQLMRFCGRVVSRDQLSYHFYSRPASATDRSVDTHVSKIRRKLGEGRGMILGVRGKGYQLRYPAGDPEVP
jgi:two-component system response regulator CpxR